MANVPSSIGFSFHKAQSTLESVPQTVIDFTTAVPEMNTLEEGRIVFEREAKALEEVLNNTLPGGTYHHLLGYMLQRKASYLVVSNDAPGITDKDERLAAAEQMQPLKGTLDNFGCRIQALERDMRELELWRQIQQGAIKRLEAAK